jgi:integrase
MRAFRAIWRRARKQHKELPEPPTINVDFFREKPRTAVIEDLPAWWSGVQSLKNPVRRDFYIWLLFTGCRRGESETLRWEQIDFDAGIAHFPVTKTAPFNLPLSDFLVDLLTARRNCEVTSAVYGDDCPWLFPASGSTGHITEPQLNKKETELFPAPWSPHTLRHTWNTISQNKVPMPPAHSRLLQNHALNTKGDAHAGYNHPDLDDLRKSQQMMSDYLVQAIKSNDNVVLPFAKRRTRKAQAKQ